MSILVVGVVGEMVNCLPDNRFGKILDICVWYVHGYVDGCDSDGVPLVGALPFLLPVCMFTFGIVFAHVSRCLYCHPPSLHRAFLNNIVPPQGTYHFDDNDWSLVQQQSKIQLCERKILP